MTESKTLVLLQLNCRSICNKALHFWNLIDTCNPDVIGRDSWLSEEINSAEVFRADCTSIRRDRHTRGGGVFICVKNCITCAEQFFGEVCEMIAVEVKCMDPKNTWEIVGVYRPPNGDLRLLEKLADWTRNMGRTMKRRIIGGKLEPTLCGFEWSRGKI
jgi:hypothetical protein